MLRRMNVDIPTEHVVEDVLKDWEERVLRMIPIEEGETDGQRWAALSLKHYLHHVGLFHYQRGSLQRSTWTIKLSGDGCEIARNKFNSLFCFSFLDLGDAANERQLNSINI